MRKLFYGLHTAFCRPSSVVATPQSDPMPGMAPNSAGGFAFPVDDWARLDRFLVLGSEGGSYYAGERRLTRENAAAVERCIAADGLRTVARIVEISRSGRAPSNDPALLALALCAAAPDAVTRRTALEALPLVARTGTHLFHFAAYAEGFRGWGRTLRRAVARWYAEQPLDELALQAVKYRSREGWSHRDLLRLAHPLAAPEDRARRALYAWICRGVRDEALPDLVRAAEDLASTADPAEAARLIRAHRLFREAVPTELLRAPEVWAALLESMPVTALVRSLAKMTEVGLLAPGSSAVARVAARLADAAAIRRARLHPLAILTAQATYARGRGLKGKLAWEPVGAVVDALDRAFYEAFAAVEPTGKRLLLALDVSSSMGWGQVAGSPLTPREASVAMALVTLAREAEAHVVGFTCAGGDPWRAAPAARFPYLHTGISALPITPRQRLDDAVRAVADLPFGGTDCALPMLYALERGIACDAFVVYTDSETWAGAIHPVQALRRYRERTGIKAKLVVVGMVSNGFSIADPDDGGMLDVVGFDTATPALIADFVRDGA